MKKLTIVMAVIGCSMAEVLAMNVSAEAVNTQAVEVTYEAGDTDHCEEEMYETQEFTGAWSDSGTFGVSGKLQWSIDIENKEMTISGNGAMDDYYYDGYGEVGRPWEQWKSVIESLVIEEGVTNIGNYAFSNFDNLQVVSISDTVTTIGDHAFHSCDRLEMVDIPSSVTAIKDCAFGFCGLDAVNIPNSVTTIGGSAFTSNKNLTEIVIPDSVEVLGSGAFSGCTSLEKVTFSKNLKEVGSNAFVNTEWYKKLKRDENGIISSDGIIFNAHETTQEESNGTISIVEVGTAKGDIILPDDTRIIAGEAFLDCSEMTSITIPNGVKYIGEVAFHGCSKLKSITIPDGITKIESSTFSDCYNLKEINLPDSITRIGGFAFSGCQSLTEMTLPQNVKSVGAYAFSNCDSLSAVTYPESVETIEDLQFGYRSSIRDITILNPHCRIGEICRRGSETVSFTYCVTMHGYPYSTAQSFAEASSWNFIPIMEEKTRSGDYGALHWDYADHVLTISGEGMLGENDSSGYDAPWQEFSSAICTLIIEDGVTEIGTGAFNKCQNITSVSLPDTLTKIGNESFAFNTSLKSIVIPDSVTEIQTGAFLNCYQLKEITLSKNLVNVGESSLAGTAWYDDLELDENSLIICQDMLFKAYADGDIVIPDGVRVIGNDAFTGVFFHNEYTTSITIPESVKYIGNSAFGNCDKLESITIPKNVEKIGKNAFSECDKLTSITILNPNCEIGEQSMISSHLITKIYGYPNSTSQTMARNFNCIFVPLEDEPQNVSKVSGDANGDGNFSLVDVVQVHKMLHTRKAPPKSCDMNKDNKVNVIDLSLMKQKLFKKQD